MKKLFLTTLFSCLLLISIKAQSTYNESEFKNKPVWIAMMHDSSVNYFQAVKAFNIFWEARVKPKEQEGENEDGERAGRKEKREQRRYEKKLARMTAAERNEFDNLNYQYKMFICWMNDVEPLVQGDGRIRKKKL